MASSIYIHLNAVKAGIVRVAEDYRWSSSNLYTKPFDGETFVNYKFVLGVLDNDIARARKIYDDMLKPAMNIKTSNMSENPDTMEHFKIEMTKIFQQFVGDRVKSNEKLSNLDVLQESELDKKIQKLKTQGRLRTPERLKARKFLIEQLKTRGYTTGIIAKKLGISRQTVSNTLNFT